MVLKRSTHRGIFIKLIPGYMKGSVKTATLLSVKTNYNCTIDQTARGLSLTIPKNGRLLSDVALVVRFDLQ